MNIDLIGWFTAWIGGLILGLATVGYLYVNGRIAGISGMISQVLNRNTLFKTPALWFLIGLLITPFFYGLYQQPKIVMMVASPVVLVISGLLVGFGTRLGSGCTSGHGICGISRLSKRSMLATLTFIVAGAVSVWVSRHMIGVML
ncbi:hypothetical protein EC844_13416 [Acinetobacter calcoaceticus]|uniref:Uncharacterized protein n=1 Tax=Acinetobacter calcoaceticus TaxID=471 RepID=A0A4R1XFN4_ACICA|nr:hypothetical protein EC844_13416 [Acinetobacter calcoaceticus]